MNRLQLKIQDKVGRNLSSYTLPNSFISVKPNQRITLEILDGKIGVQRNVVVLNSAAGLIAAGKAADFSEGIALATQSIDSGGAKRILSELRRISNEQ